MKKNIAGQHIAAGLILRSDGTNATGLSISVGVSIDGAAVGGGGGSILELGDGAYIYTPTQAETDGDSLVFIFSEATCITQAINVYTDDGSTIKKDTPYRWSNNGSGAGYDDVSIGDTP